MEQYKKDFINFMVSCGALRFGSFTLKSGRQSPFFMNTGAYDTGASIMLLGEFYAQAVYERFGEDFDVFFGPAYKGIPLCVSTAMAYFKLYGKEVRYTSNRKEVKDHGDGGILLGSTLKEGDRVVIVEDVTTSGKSIEETYPIVTATDGVIVTGEVVSLDRMEKASEKDTLSALDAISQKYKFPAFPIVTIKDVIEELDGTVITKDIRSSLEKYYKEWGAGGLEL